MAREHAPSIIFMDEIDSIGSSRGGSGSGGGDSEVQRTMLELLNQLDGFEATKNIKVRRHLETLSKKSKGKLTSHSSTMFKHRSSWRRTESIFSTRPSFDLVE